MGRPKTSQSRHPPTATRQSRPRVTCRADAREGNLEVTYFIDLDGTGQISSLVDELNQVFPGVGVSFIDQSRMPTV